MKPGWIVIEKTVEANLALKFFQVIGMAALLGILFWIGALMVTDNSMVGIGDKQIDRLPVPIVIVFYATFGLLFPALAMNAVFGG